MILNATVAVTNGQQEVTFVSSPTGETWQNFFLPAFLQSNDATNLDPTKYWIAALDTGAGQWLQLAQPWPGPSNASLSVIIFADFTPHLGLPLANPGDVNIADLWNRAMGLLDQIGSLTGVLPHGPTHIGTGSDPVPTATAAYSGTIGPISGHSTDYIAGDGNCYPLSGLPTGAVFLWPITALPANCLACDGGQYSRTTYANLYSVLGGALSPWGQGDGHSTFNTPDFRGRVPMGAGTGPGLSTRSVGQKFGEESHTLVVAELPSITFSYTYDGWSSTGGNLGFTHNQDTYKLTLADVAKSNPVGGGVAHNNIQPSTVVQFVIRI